MSGDSISNPVKDISFLNPFGGKNSVINNPDQIWGGDDSVFRKPFGSGPDSPASPPPAPDPTKATQDALAAQLQQELQIRRSNTLVTGGQGVTQPPSVLSAGTTLLGR